MQKNKAFKKYIELVENYKSNPTKSRLEECQKEAAKMISLGWANPTMKVVYDLGIEKYTAMGLKNQSLEVYDKDKSIKGILKKTYGQFLPKQAIDEVPFKRLIFHPHKPQAFTEDGIDNANMLIKSKFLSFKPQPNERINEINWGAYPNIKALFENVFKSTERMDYFANWLAVSFQTLNKTGTAIISKGVQGAGKGIIYERIIQYAIGERYTTLLENEALKSRFNGELENKLFVLANEIKADFREGNTIYERLKIYITDSSIRFEEKNTKARTIPNYFNIWFHSNNDIPLQIQGSDRRYTVFNTKSQNLKEVSKALGYGFITDYLDAVNEERDNFIFDLMKLKYDLHRATVPMNTAEKEMIYEASMSKLEVLTDKIKKKDTEYFMEQLQVFYDSHELEKQIGDLRILNLETHEDFTRELQKQFNGNYITNKLLEVMYKIFVKEVETANNIGRHFSKYFEPAQQKKLTHKYFRYRAIDSDQEVNFTHQIPLLVDQPDGTIEAKVLNVGNGVYEVEKADN